MTPVNTPGQHGRRKQQRRLRQRGPAAQQHAREQNLSGHMRDRAGDADAHQPEIANLQEKRHHGHAQQSARKAVRRARRPGIQHAAQHRLEHHHQPRAGHAEQAQRIQQHGIGKPQPDSRNPGHQYKLPFHKPQNQDDGSQQSILGDLFRRHMASPVEK